MTTRRVTVFGGSGFVGHHIVLRLAEDGAEVRIAVRHPERARPLEHRGRIEAVHADVWDQATVGPALEGSDAVINTVGHYVQRGEATFEAIHGHGAMHVARAATAAGVERLVHVSGLGADPNSDSPYVRARGIGEELVREAFPVATIFRPSVVFGPGDAFFNRLAGLTRTMPVLPLFGAGEVRLQPVYVGDIAEAALQALATPDSSGRIYELGGPRIYSYREILKLVLAQTRRRRLLLPVPYVAWDVLAAALSVLPNPPVSRDQVKLMSEDNVVSSGALGLAELDVAPTPVETVLPRYIG